MIFKLPDCIPNLQSNAQEWADYAEFLAIRNSSISLISLCRDPKLVDDEIEINGIDDTSDNYLKKFDEITSEIQLRINHLGEKYPFILTNHGYSIELNDNVNLCSKIYKYLLLCTRVKMTGPTGANRIINGVDGALVFELLCGEVSKNFFGKNTELDVFGTSKATGSSFTARLKNMINRLGEGRDANDYPGSRPQDDKVDLIIWKSSTDKNSSKFIGFGQCKTGTSWLNRLSDLDTDVFCKKWFHTTPIVTPLKMFFCAQYFPRNQWNYYARSAGLIFDRFRIIEFLPENIESSILDQIENWYMGAEAQYLIYDNSKN